MANTTRTQIPREVNNYYDKNLLIRAVPRLVYGLWGKESRIPANAGTNTIKFRRYVNLADATTPLTEGVTPPAATISTVEVTATYAQYGNYLTYTDVVSFESADSAIMDMTNVLGDNAGSTYNILTRNILEAGINVNYSGTGNTSRADLGATDIITSADIAAAVLELKIAHAKKLTSFVNPQTGINTTAILPAFIGLCHVKQSPTIKAMSGFVGVEKYGNRSMIHPQEIGMIEGVRVIETEEASEFTSTVTVYPFIILAEQAYGKTVVDGQSLTTIVKPIGFKDELDQVGSVGWKGTYVAKILNDDFMVRIESALV